MLRVCERKNDAIHMKPPDVIDPFSWTSTTHFAPPLCLTGFYVSNVYHLYLLIGIYITYLPAVYVTDLVICTYS